MEDGMGDESCDGRRSACGSRAWSRTEAVAVLQGTGPHILHRHCCRRAPPMLRARLCLLLACLYVCLCGLGRAALKDLRRALRKEWNPVEMGGEKQGVGLTLRGEVWDCGGIVASERVAGLAVASGL
jgi:hypothetical protein